MNVSKRKNLFMVRIVILLFLMVCFSGMPQIIQATDEAKGPVQFNVKIPLADNLIAFKGKTVTVSLSSGQTCTGIVKDVKSHLLHLEKITQKEFYDVIIRLDHISTVEARVR